MFSARGFSSSLSLKMCMKWHVMILGQLVNLKNEYSACGAVVGLLLLIHRIQIPYLSYICEFIDDTRFYMVTLTFNAFSGITRIVFMMQ